MKNLDNNQFIEREFTYACGCKGTFIGLPSNYKAHAEECAKEECVECDMKRMKKLEKKYNLPEIQGATDEDELDTVTVLRWYMLGFDEVREMLERFINGSEKEREELRQRAEKPNARKKDWAVFCAVALCTKDTAEWWEENC